MWAGLLVVPTLAWRASSIDVTPPLPLPLGGYTERQGALSEPGGDRLSAKTIIFEGEGRRVALVMFEALTVPESLVAAVRSRLPRDLELVIVATHTHCAPDSQMLNERMTLGIPGIANHNRVWAEWYADRLAAGVRGALDAPAHAVSRLSIRVAHVRANHGRRPNARPDPRAWSIEADGTTLVAMYGAHATLYGDDERHLRSDWPGALARRMDALVLPAAIGDVGPEASGATPAERVDSMAGALSGALAKSRTATIWSPGMPWGVARAAIALGPPMAHPQFAKGFGAPEPLAQLAVKRFAPKSGEVVALALGRLVLLLSPAEPSAAVGRAMERAGSREGFDWAVPISHANGWIGYVLEPKDYDAGGYEATLGFYGRTTSHALVAASRAAAAQCPRGSTEARSACGQSL